jgi:hypothetical protein
LTGDVGRDCGDASRALLFVLASTPVSALLTSPLYQRRQQISYGTAGGTGCFRIGLTLRMRDMPERADTDHFRKANRGLDAANFFLADVRDGLGPYLAIYLLTEQKWDEARIGIVMSIATLAGIVAQTPAGALVDATKAKRLVMVIAAILVTSASLLLPLFPDFWPAAMSQGIAHAAGVVFPPAIAAVSLGIVGHRAFTARIGPMRHSTMPAMLPPPASRERPPICLGRRLCSICWRQHRSPAL